MANFSLGGGDETRPNLLSGGYGTVRAGGGSFAVLTAGGFTKLTPYETTSRGARAAIAAGVVVTVGGGIANNAGGGGGGSPYLPGDDFDGKPDRDFVG